MGCNTLKQGKCITNPIGDMSGEIGGREKGVDRDNFLKEGRHDAYNVLL